MPHPSRRDPERDKLALQAYTLARSSKRGMHPRLSRIPFGRMTEAELHEFIAWHTPGTNQPLAA